MTEPLKQQKNEIETRQSPALNPVETPKEARDSIRELEILGIIIVENNKSMREKHESIIEKTLNKYEEDYIIASMPNETQTYEFLGGQTKPEIETDLLLLDNKLNNKQGGLQIAEYAHPSTNHIALHTTGTTLQKNKTGEYTTPNYIDTLHLKTGQNDLVGPKSYQKLLNQALQKNKENNIT